MEIPKDPSARGPSPERVHPGEIIRRVRNQRGMSVRELARRIALTPSHLSRIERGLASPSVGALWTISDELGIAVSALFVDESQALPDSAASTPSAPTTVRDHSSTPQVSAPVVDPGHRELIRMAGVEFQRLTPHDDLSVEFMEVRHAVGAGDREAYHHRGREYGLVLEGRLQVEIGFAKYLLDPGWSVAFDSSNPHRVLNVGDGPAVAIWLVVGRNQV